MPFIEEITVYSPQVYEAVKILLMELTGDTAPPFSENRFKEIIKAENSHLFIVKENSLLEEKTENIAGMLTVGTYHTPGGTKAWIEDVVVSNVYRGKGYGKMLVQYAIDFVQSQGIDMLMLTSRPSRVIANQLYLNLGFKIKQTNLYIK